jgi:Zn ribbon nucleic-acid-binding protein
MTTCPHCHEDALVKCQQDDLSTGVQCLLCGYLKISGQRHPIKRRRKHKSKRPGRPRKRERR